MLGWILVILYLAVAALPFKLKILGLKGRIAWAVIAAIIFAGLRVAIQISTEALWFADLGYDQRYWNILLPEIGIFAVSFVSAFGFIMANFLYVFKTTRTPHVLQNNCYLRVPVFCIGILFRHDGRGVRVSPLQQSGAFQSCGANFQHGYRVLYLYAALS